MQVGHGLDVELLGELHRSLGTDARDFHETQGRLGYARSALLDGGELTRVEVFDNLGADRFANPVQLLDTPLVGHDFDWLVMVLDTSGGVAIVRHAVAVLAQQLHRVRKLVERGRDFSILHPTCCASVRARRKIASNIGTVSLRVNVFC